MAVYTVENVHSKEECFVDNVKLCGDFTISGAKKACITVRVPVSIEPLLTYFPNFGKVLQEVRLGKVRYLEFYPN